MIILPCLEIFFVSFNYLTAVFLISFAFGCLFRLFGFKRWNRYTKG